MTTFTAPYKKSYFYKCVIIFVTPQNPGCPLTIRQPAEIYMSHVMMHVDV